MDGDVIPVADDWGETAPLLLPFCHTMAKEVVSIDLYERRDRRGKEYVFHQRFVPYNVDFDIELFPDDDDDDREAEELG